MAYQLHNPKNLKGVPLIDKPVVTFRAKDSANISTLNAWLECGITFGLVCAPTSMPDLIICSVDIPSASVTSFYSLLHTWIWDGFKLDLIFNPAGMQFMDGSACPSNTPGKHTVTIKPIK